MSELYCFYYLLKEVPHLRFMDIVLFYVLIQFASLGQLHNYEDVASSVEHFI